MGMSASQARLLQLEARQSNLEYQGQQINQARTHLSQQSTALYSSLLDMKVPTPPSKQDYQTLQYQGKDGASSFTLGTITPGAGDTYDVEMKYTRNGKCLKGGQVEALSTKYSIPETINVANAATLGYQAPVTSEYQYIKYDMNKEIKGSDIKSETNPNGLDGSTQIMHAFNEGETFVKKLEDKGIQLQFFYMGDKGEMILAGSKKEALDNGNGYAYVKTTIQELKDTVSVYSFDNADFSDYVCQGDLTKATNCTGGLDASQATGQFYDKNGNPIELEQIPGTDKYKLPEGAYKLADDGVPMKNPKYNDKDAEANLSMGDSSIMDFDTALAGLSNYDEIITSIVHTFPEYQGNESKIPNDFKVFFRKNKSGEQVPNFVKTTDFESHKGRSLSNDQNRLEYFSLEANGTYTEAVTEKGCELKFDTSGRITTLRIPTTKDGVTTWTEYELEPKQVTDEDAYNDAMNEYEYEQHLYDQEVKKINAQTEVIQQQDRNLELKLQRLDNERTQITTEIDAVKKVINDNIQASYKTFSG